MELFLTYFISYFATLFVVIDPIMTAPIFVSLTRQDTPKRKLSLAIQAALTAFIILLFFGFFGEFILKHTGISFAAFQTSGGFLLFLMGFNMFFNPDDSTEAKTPGPKAAARENIAFFPLGMPILAGPGSIATVMLLVADDGNQSKLFNIITVYSAVFLTLFITVIICFFSSFISAALGRTGMNMISRILGMFLMALSTQYIFEGLKQGLFTG